MYGCVGSFSLVIRSNLLAIIQIFTKFYFKRKKFQKNRITQNQSLERCTSFQSCVILWQFMLFLYRMPLIFWTNKRTTDFSLSLNIILCWIVTVTICFCFFFRCAPYNMIKLHMKIEIEKNEKKASVFCRMCVTFSCA